MNTIGDTLQRVIEQYAAGNLQEAELGCRQVLSVDPDNPDAIHFLGVIAYKVGRLDIAKEYINRAIKLAPENAACYNNMGNVSQSEKDFEGAVHWYTQTIQRDPGNQKAYNNLGVALTRLGRLEESALNFKTALKIDPNYVDAHNNLGETWRYLGEYDKALESTNKALSLSREYPMARWNRSFLYLLTGDFKKGWPEYEWRWRKPNVPVRKFETGSAWDGSALNGKTVFVYEEQGMGDTLQFIRYLPLIKEAGGKVILEVLPPLLRLVLSFEGFDRLWAGIRNVDTRPTDRFDYHVPIMSLPGIFNTDIHSVPASVPYLHADPQLARVWARRMEDQGGFRIGIVWAGHPDHNNDYNRSVHLSRFAPLKKIEGISLYSLQKDKYDRWTDMDPSDLFKKDLGDDIIDFADTAAIMENLDLVISVDTSVVHLAGAMGKPIWTLLPFSPDWRWMLDRDDTPWYPTMKLFRQPGQGEWEPVFNRVKLELEKLLEK